MLAFVGSVLLVGLLLTPAAVHAGSADAASSDAPSRVIIIVLDQTRRDTIERYGMQNVQGLAGGGVSFPKAYLGHMAAETVVSHNVMTSGQLPKNMGWSNEIYRDVANVTGLGAGAYHVTSSMSCSQFNALIDAGGYLKLQDYLDAQFGESSTFASIAQKRTAACTGGQTAGSSDPEHFILQIRGSSTSFDCDADTVAETWRMPEDGNGTAPAYLGLATPCNRFWTQQSDSYGTSALAPAWMYPLEGNRFAPGFDPAHIGGDTWSADVAIQVIENDPNWHGMLVSLGAIDKMGHMWGPNDQGEPGALPGSVEEMRHLPFIAKTADAQVGRIVDALEAAGILDETLIVITADHGAQTGERFYGINQPSRSDFNWYYGIETTTGTNEDYRMASPAIQQLVDALGTDLGFSYQDSHIALLLNDTSLASLQEAALAVRALPDVVAAYYRDGDHYVKYGSVGLMTRDERRWFRQHAQELVDTMASDVGPDVVGLLHNDVTYGVYGDHGGHQAQVQDIPVIFSWSGLRAGATPRTQIRSVDLLPTILRLMGISFDPGSMDGTAVALPLG
jgi:predicted AlkP superfamily pyrophosphatase or phosphodiesterase